MCLALPSCNFLVFMQFCICTNEYFLSHISRYAGQVGYIITNMRKTEEAQIGDTFCHEGSTVEPLPGFKPAKAMVNILLSV